MADPDSLGEPELEWLERRLGRVRFSPTAAQRERLLYACGQAAGRAQMMRRVRGATAAAALLGILSAGLGVALLARESSKSAATAPPRLPPPEQQFDRTTSVAFSESDERENVGGQILTAATRFEGVLLSDRRDTTGNGANRQDLARTRILTAAGPSAFNEF